MTAATVPIISSVVTGCTSSTWRQHPNRKSEPCTPMTTLDCTACVAWLASVTPVRLAELGAKKRRDTSHAATCVSAWQRMADTAWHESGRRTSHQQDGAHAHNGVDGEVEEGLRQLCITRPCGDRRTEHVKCLCRAWCGTTVVRMQACHDEQCGDTQTVTANVSLCSLSDKHMLDTDCKQVVLTKDVVGAVEEGSRRVAVIGAVEDVRVDVLLGISQRPVRLTCVFALQNRAEFRV